MSNKTTRLAVMAAIKQNLEQAQSCGLTQATKAKEHVTKALHGLMLLQNDFINAIEQLEQQFAAISGGKHD